jgi:hypothetical protein
MVDLDTSCNIVSSSRHAILKNVYKVDVEVNKKDNMDKWGTHSHFLKQNILFF